MLDHEGWTITNVTTPEGLVFNIATKEGVLRIRRFGWLPLELTRPEGVTPETNTRVDITISPDLGLGALIERKTMKNEEMRTFDSGATRNNDDDNLDFEGFLSPAVLERYAIYMHTHRVQADGKMRDSDNWQKGLPIPQYMKSMWRHFLDVWKIHRGWGTCGITRQEALCALLFNVMGMLHEVIKEEQPSQEININEGSD